jgi:hypothetical protein
MYMYLNISNIFFYLCTRALVKLQVDHDSLRSHAGILLTWLVSQCVTVETLQLGGIEIWLMRDIQFQTCLITYSTL